MHVFTLLTHVPLVILNLEAVSNLASKLITFIYTFHRLHYSVTTYACQMFGRLASTVFNAARQASSVLFEKQLHTASQACVTNGLCSSNANVTAGGSWTLIPVRNHVRYHFPYPKEHIRVRRHGWWRRMSTPNGRRVLMRRILKGRYVLSH